MENAKNVEVCQVEEVEMKEKEMKTNKFKQFVVDHKKPFIIGAAGLLGLGLLAVKVIFMPATANDILSIMEEDAEDTAEGEE